MTSRTLLCVDDEVKILNALTRVLRREGYTLLSASSAEDGLHLLETHPIQVVLSDQRMPGLLGTQFLQLVKTKYPHTVRVILSGYSDEVTILGALYSGDIYKFFPKPWDDAKLKENIRKCFEHYEVTHPK